MRYGPDQKFYKLTRDGVSQFPIHKGKLFILRFSPDAHHLVIARRVDQKSWCRWARSFFRKVSG